MKTLNKLGVLTLILGPFLVLNACGNKSSKPETENRAAASSDKTEMSTETDVRNEVVVDSARSYIEVNLTELQGAKRGDRIRLHLVGREMSYDLAVQRVQEQVPGIKNISAHIVNKETGLATMNIRDGRLSGILDFYSKDLRYRIGYDSGEDRYFILETKVQSLEEKAGDDPMTPKMHNN
jgi:hypothetical protein